MQKPDEIVTFVTPFAEIQIRMGLPPIESLLAERDTLVSKVAKLRARHGSFGTWDSERKVVLETGAAIIRAKAATENRKITEAQIESEKHTAESYLAFLTESLIEKATWIETENRIQSVEDLIQRGNVVGRFLASEAMLAR